MDTAVKSQVPRWRPPRLSTYLDHTHQYHRITGNPDYLLRLWLILSTKSTAMSVSNTDWHLASADCLFTDNEYIRLLEEFSDDKDLLKTIRCAAPNTESFGDFEITEESPTFYPPSPPEIKPNEAELAEVTLQQLENECKQENVLPNWYEEKTNLALFEPIPQVAERVEPIPAAEHFTGPTGPYVAQIVPERTQELLREFQTVYEVVGQTHDTYTPPQSPAGPATRLLVNFAHQTQCAPITPLVPIPLNEWQVNGTAELDDLVRHHVAQLASPQPSIPSVTPSPRSSPQSSPSSSPRSSSNDEEWCTSSRPKPYSRSTDDRRSRKKEQNKNAATRYRQKKKAEIEELLTEEQGLKQRNTELHSKCAELKRDTNCIKKLLRDVFKSKGLIK